jgi:hypothetical protein
MTASVGTHAVLDIVSYTTTSSSIAIGRRAFDTRTGFRLGSPIAIITTSFRCFGPDEIGITLPPDALVTATITGIRPAGIGFISIFQRGDPIDATSSLNIKDGLNLANTTTFVTDDDGEFCVHASSYTDATLDIISAEAEPDAVIVNQRIFDTRRPPLATPVPAPAEPVYVAGDRSLIGRVTVDCRFSTSGNGTFFEVTVDDIPRDNPVGPDGIYNQINTRIDLFGPPHSHRGFGSSMIDSDSIFDRVFIEGRHTYMRGSFQVRVASGSGSLPFDVFSPVIEGGTTFDVPGIACRDWVR